MPTTSVIRELRSLPRRVIAFFLHDPRVFLKYIAVGGTGSALEFACFNLFYSVFHWPLLGANCAAIAAYIAFSFTLQKKWTFRDNQAIRRQLPWYLGMISVAVVMNNALIYLFVAVLGWNAALSKILQIGIVFCWNFTISRLVVFAAGRH